LGAVSGHLQNILIRDLPGEIATASSMKELQQKWRATPFGKRSFIFRQVSMAFYGLLVIWYGVSHGGLYGSKDPVGRILLTFFACDLTFMFARELMTLRTVFELQRNLGTNVR
jgi:hypothetical protein